jgi:hypothetical protein
VKLYTKEEVYNLMRLVGGNPEAVELFLDKAEKDKPLLTEEEAPTVLRLYDLVWQNSSYSTPRWDSMRVARHIYRELTGNIIVPKEIEDYDKSMKVPEEIDAIFEIQRSINELANNLLVKRGQ